MQIVDEGGGMPVDLGVERTEGIEANSVDVGGDLPAGMDGAL